MKHIFFLKKPPCRVAPLIGGALLVSWLAGGCSKAPEAPPAEKIQQTFDSQIQAIQNNAQMSDAAKQQAIAGIKAQQARTTAQK